MRSFSRLRQIQGRLMRLTQTGHRHGSQMEGTHGVWPLGQRSDELEVEDSADQAADAAR